MPYSIENLKILICDDAITNTMILAKLLESEGYHHVQILNDPRKVLSTMEETEYDLLLLDIEMPELSGFDVMSQISESPVASQQVPILILTGRQDQETRLRALDSGAQDFLSKPFDQMEVLLRVRNLLRARASYIYAKKANHELEQKITNRTRELERATDFLIDRLAKVGEMRDTDTGKHVLRVGKYARVLSDAYGLPPDIGFLIEKAAPLHDLGKVAIPDNILLKKGLLNEDEREFMKHHAKLGADLLSDHESMLVKMASSIALTHHEHWDGKGYPAQLQGESIAIEGRITAISDVFDALISVRPYKKAWSVEDASELIKSESGKHFDPSLVKLFLENFDKILAVKNKYLDK